MTIRSIDELLDQADASFPDNNALFITPALLRDFVKDTVETLATAYGSIVLSTPLVMALTTTPAVVKPFQTALVLTSGMFAADLPNGAVSRLLAGIPKTATIFVVGGSISASGGLDVEVRLFKNGVATAFFQHVSASGLTNTEPFNFGAYDVADVDAVYDLRAKLLSGSGNVTFNQVSFSAYSTPVRSFL